MIVTTEGIIFKQIKTVNGRRMIQIFSKTYGKISAGTGISEKARGKSSLAIRPFTYGKYELYKNNDRFNINGGETIKSFYSLGEDIDKYMYGSFVLELTEKLLPENVPSQKVFVLLCDFLEELEKRKKKYDTLLIAYEIKVLKELGYMPNLGKCKKCNSREGLEFFDVKEGGVYCEKCGKDEINLRADSLIYRINTSIIDIIKYFSNNPFSSFRKLALKDDVAVKINRLLRDFIEYHLDIGELKSGYFLSDNLYKEEGKNGNYIGKN